MRKIYVKPGNEVVCLYGNLSLFTASGGELGVGDPNQSGSHTSGALSKERDGEEDYAAEGGAGYGNLW